MPSLTSAVRAPRCPLAVAATGLLALSLLAACGDDSSASTPTTADGPAATFASPVDGDHIVGSAQLSMRADGVTIEPAGEVHEGAGHFHVLVDTGCLEEGTSIPKDAQHVHFGKGQTEAELFLPAGRHELCLQIGDGVHAATTMTDQVTVEVGARSQDEWCEVMNEVDEVTNEHPFELGDFADVKAAYTDGLQLVDQLEAGIEHVDADARADVAALLQLFEDVAGAVIDSPDRETAAPQVEALFSGQDLHVGPAFDWMTTTCGVD